ncbi:G patch domain-containing protein 11 [Osmia bicornis bicornis]|uniref:G patch domain-containing protein 11 n=1 Tax=Osmia bicornis bicornis TaxID=1437191 RepID=UPI0010F8B8CE|nr:G patch domain-containing protein 11 [Osmia bicornis bicornis]XP_029048133.1 G patch domain-containing protein 11 [Osmia bicornis bicornis]
MSDEEDYMSDKFLQGSQKDTSSTLLYRHADKRKFELMKKKSEIEAKLKEKGSAKYIEEEKREAGLSSAITSTNKGFEMLMKMGYKPGHGIGKTESGMTEPLGVEVKLNRHGLGKEAKKKEVKVKTNSISDKLDNKNMKDFRGRIAQKRAEQLLKADLYKSQKICEQLDMQLNLEKPREIWFWLPQENDESDDTDSEEDDEETLPVNEKLDILTKYLREKHFYCIWCGTTFQNTEDLRDNCPGNTRDDH